MVYRGKKPNQRHVVKQTSNKQHAFGENSKSKVHFNYSNLKAWTKLGETVLEHGVNTLQRLKSTHSVSSTWKSSLPVLYNVILPNFFLQVKAVLAFKIFLYQFQRLPFPLMAWFLIFLFLPDSFLLHLQCLTNSKPTTCKTGKTCFTAEKNLLIR